LAEIFPNSQLNSTLITGGKGVSDATAAGPSEEPAVTQDLTKEVDDAMIVDTGM
jgi:hypothetical protein